MKLNEAISHLEKSLADPSHDWGCEECKAEHEQLLEWLTELKDLRAIFSKVDTGAIKPKDYLDLLDEWGKMKELLKKAVEDFKKLEYQATDKEGHCTLDVACEECVIGAGDGIENCKWNYADAATALLEKIEKDSENND